MPPSFITFLSGGESHQHRFTTPEWPPDLHSKLQPCMPLPIEEGTTSKRDSSIDGQHPRGLGDLHSKLQHYMPLPSEESTPFCRLLPENGSSPGRCLSCLSRVRSTAVKIQPPHARQVGRGSSTDGQHPQERGDRPGRIFVSRVTKSKPYTPGRWGEPAASTDNTPGASAICTLILRITRRCTKSKPYTPGRWGEPAASTDGKPGVSVIGRGGPSCLVLLNPKPTRPADGESQQRR